MGVVSFMIAADNIQLAPVRARINGSLRELQAQLEGSELTADVDKAWDIIGRALDRYSDGHPSRASLQGMFDERAGFQIDGVAVIVHEAPKVGQQAQLLADLDRHEVRNCAKAIIAAAYPFTKKRQPDESDLDWALEFIDDLTTFFGLAASRNLGVVVTLEP